MTAGAKNDPLFRDADIGLELVVGLNEVINVDEIGWLSWGSCAVVHSASLPVPVASV